MDGNALTSVIILKPLIRVKRVEIVTLLFKNSVAYYKKIKWSYPKKQSVDPNPLSLVVGPFTL
jgi:hypothetical protein